MRAWSGIPLKSTNWWNCHTTTVNSSRKSPLSRQYCFLYHTTPDKKFSFCSCPKSDGDDSRAPTMCLVCGTMLCSQSYCCQTEMDNATVGAATAHAQTCGAGTGIFLRLVSDARCNTITQSLYHSVRECQVLLMSGRTKGCFFAPPYLDDYGETDQGLRLVVVITLELSSLIISTQEGQSAASV